MPLAEDIALIARQEAILRFPRFDEETAWQLGSRLREMAVSRELPIVIDVRRFGQPLFYSALAGTSPDNAEWARRKGNAVARFHRSSYAMGLEMQLKNTTLFDKFGLTLVEFAAHGGGFPLAVAEAGVIGSVTVSGLPQRDDHQLVVEALCLETGHDFSALRL
ncbi:MAG TPA: heme-degrading domain-containing protein [Bryobacteraceae bacterium]|nr:heme-degrading domain-containing protein [Bryobacteraceae bacterium]